MSAPKNHPGSFEIVARNPNVWLASCGRHFKATGATYEQVEDKWRQHVYETSGTLIEPWGTDRENRWQPELSPAVSS